MNTTYFEKYCASDEAWLFTWNFLLEGGSAQRANRNASKAKQIWLRAKSIMSDKIRVNGKVLVTGVSKCGGDCVYR